MTERMLFVMKAISALELRQSMGKVVAALRSGGDPIVLEKNRKPVAVLISLQDFHERFVTKAAAQERQALADAIDALARPSVERVPAEHLLRDLRDHDA
jgi:prevent-host-death family protein